MFFSASRRAVVKRATSASNAAQSGTRDVLTSSESFEMQGNEGVNGGVGDVPAMRSSAGAGAVVVAPSLAATGVAPSAPSPLLLLQLIAVAGGDSPLWSTCIRVATSSSSDSRGGDGGRSAGTALTPTSLVLRLGLYGTAARSVVAVVAVVMFGSWVGGLGLSCASTERNGATRKFSGEAGFRGGGAGTTAGSAGAVETEPGLADGAYDGTGPCLCRGLEEEVWPVVMEGDGGVTGRTLRRRLARPAPPSLLASDS